MLHNEIYCCSELFIVRGHQGAVPPTTSVTPTLVQFPPPLQPRLLSCSSPHYFNHASSQRSKLLEEYIYAHIQFLFFR